MKLSKTIVTSLLNKAQIEVLQELYSVCVGDYLADLEIDPYCHDYTDETLTSNLRIFLEKNTGQNPENWDVELIYRLIKTELI